MITVIALASVVYAAVFTFTKTIYDERGCDFGNIDNIELHTNLDIPETVACDCEYFEGMDIKNSVFTLDKSKVNFTDYIVRHKFLPHDSHQSISLDFANLENSTAGFRDRQQLYYRGGESQQATYRMILDTNRARLYIILKYKT